MSVVQFQSLHATACSWQNVRTDDCGLVSLSFSLS